MAYRIVILLIACAAVIFFLKREEGRGTFVDSSNRVYLDFLIGNSKDKIGDPSVILVTIDDAGTSTPEPWECAVLFKELLRHKPKVTVMSEVLDWKPDAKQPLFEASISSVADKAEQIPSLVLSTVVMQDPSFTGEGKSKSAADGRFDLFASMENIEGDLEELPACNVASQIPAHLLAQGTLRQAVLTSKKTGFYLGMGFSHIDLGESLQKDEGEDALLIPLLARTPSGQVIPSLVLQTILFERKRTAREVHIRLGREIQVDDGLSIPIDRKGRLRIFLGFRDRIPRVDAGSLLLEGPDDELGNEIKDEIKSGSGTGAATPGADGNGNGQSAAKSKLSLLARAQESIIVIGTDSAAARVLELPGGTVLSRAEVTALALATIQGNQYFKKFGEVWTYFLWAAIILIGIWQLRMPGRKALLVAFVLLVLYASASILTFQASLRWTGFMIPLGLIATATLMAQILPPMGPRQPRTNESTSS